MKRVAAPRRYVVVIVFAAIAGCSQAPPPGESLAGSGQYKAAIQTFEKRLQTDAKLASDADARARVKTLLAYAKAMQGDAVGADALFAEAANDAASAEAKAHLQLYQGLVRSEQSRWQESAELLASAETAFRELGLGRSLEFGLTLAGQGLLRALQGDTAGGERMLAQAVPILRRYREHYPVFYAEAATNLATMLVMRSDFTGAQPHYEDALQSLRNAKPDETEDLGHALNGLAYTQYQAGNYNAAESNLNEAIEAFTALGKDSAADVAKCYHDLAKVYEFAQQPEKAEEAFRKAIDLYAQVLGPKHPYTQQTQQSAAEFLRGQGREDEAAELEGVDEPDDATTPDESESVND